MYGFISYISCRLPKDKELEDCCHLKMTEDKEWEHYNKILEVREESFTHTKRNLMWENPISMSSVVVAVSFKERKSQVSPEN